MMKQAALHRFKSFKNGSKPKPFFLANITKHNHPFVSDVGDGVAPVKTGAKRDMTMSWSVPPSRRFCTNTARDFKVMREPPELVAPAKPTPREVKQESVSPAKRDTTMSWSIPLSRRFCTNTARDFKVMREPPVPVAPIEPTPREVKQERVSPAKRDTTMSWSVPFSRRFCTNTARDFKVTREPPELVVPAGPTPQEVKELSDIDDQPLLRFLVPVVQLYRYDPSMQGKDPARVIRDALAKAFVFYYPFVGRLREGPDGKLYMDYIGEGVAFVEADADVELAHFTDMPDRSSFPCFEELVHDVPPFQGVINSPLLLIQVTRMKCGGFILAVCLNHVMSDAQGLVQFLTAVAQIARGAHAPSVVPVWCRDILNARDPPRITFTHHMYEKVENPPPIVFSNHPDATHRSFFFRPSDMLALRRTVPPHIASHSTTFEVLTASLWQCFVSALEPDSQEEVILSCAVSARRGFDAGVRVHVRVPNGYYGNAFVLPSVSTTASELCGRPTAYAVELVKRAKGLFGEEYMQSQADLMAVKGRASDHPPGRFFSVSDARRIGIADVDYGWGTAAFGGPPRMVGEGVAVYVPFKNREGEEGILVPLCFRAHVMDKFELELSKMLTRRS